MNLDNVHTPERLTNETQPEYRARQRMSKRLAERMTLLVKGKQAAAPKAKRARRALVAKVGIRQAKLILRGAR